MEISENVPETLGRSTSGVRPCLGWAAGGVKVIGPRGQEGVMKLWEDSGISIGCPGASSRCMTALFGLSGCASLPEIQSSDGFQGTVYDAIADKPAPFILIVGKITTELSAWDNSGRGGGPHILVQDYAISDAQGHFTFPSLTAVAGPAVYSFGLVRTISHPYYEMLGIGYKGSESNDKKDEFIVMPCDPNPSMLEFETYLKGDTKLDFRSEDYPVLLQLLEKWHEVRNEHLQKSEEDEKLYQDYLARFRPG
jgi:hypothetical protein